MLHVLLNIICFIFEKMQMELNITQLSANIPTGGNVIADAGRDNWSILNISWNSLFRHSNNWSPNPTIDFLYADLETSPMSEDTCASQITKAPQDLSVNHGKDHPQTEELQKGRGKDCSFPDCKVIVGLGGCWCGFGVHSIWHNDDVKKLE